MKEKIIKSLIVILFLVSVAIATETTWRHSGFEVTSFDINLSSTFNITELRVLEWGWNTSIPSASNANRAIMYYDNNNKKMMQSINGSGYEEVMTNVSNGSALFGLNMTNSTFCTSGITCTYNTNNSVSLTVTSSTSSNSSAISYNTSEPIGNATTNRTNNTVLNNTNLSKTLMLLITAQAQTTVAGGSALIYCNSPSNVTNNNNTESSTTNGSYSMMESFTVSSPANTIKFDYRSNSATWRGSYGYTINNNDATAVIQLIYDYTTNAVITFVSQPIIMNTNDVVRLWVNSSNAAVPHFIQNAQLINNTQISGKVGIENGLLNQNVVVQLTCLIPPNSTYMINHNASNGNIAFRDWREQYI